MQQQTKYTKIITLSNRKRNISYLLLLFFTASLLSAQKWETPIIEGYGGVQYDPAYEEAFSPDENYKLLFDVTSSGKKDGVNRGLWRVARTLNLMAACGVPKENIEVVVALHGGATQVALSDTAYQEIFEKANPNAVLLSQLAENGVSLFVCAQAMVGRSYPLDQLYPSVRLALSALTVVANYQKKGFILIP